LVPVLRRRDDFLAVAFCAFRWLVFFFFFDGVFFFEVFFFLPEALGCTVPLLIFSRSSPRSELDQ